ncbi:MAG TPA: hypothetical protein VJR89_43270 [Polyangiales bacterium]|nr:hypothetical protein [Polyangiales bacterium]
MIGALKVCTPSVPLKTSGGKISNLPCPEAAPSDSPVSDEQPAATLSNARAIERRTDKECMGGVFLSVTRACPGTCVSGRPATFPWSRATAVVLASVWLLCATQARAAERVELSYTAPRDCPNRESVLRTIDGLLEDSPAVDRTLQVAAEIRENEDASFALVLTWRDAQGQGRRDIEAESCQAAADAAAWLIAQAVKRPAEPSESSPVHFDVGLQGSVDFGALPGAGLGAALRFGVTWSVLHADLSLTYFPAKNAEHAGASADIDLAELSVEFCYIASSAPFVFGPCARAAIGRMAASSQDLRVPNSGAERIQSFGLAVQLRARLAGELWLFSDAALDWHQRRPVFAVMDSGTLHEPTPFGLRLVLGLALSLR